MSKRKKILITATDLHIYQFWTEHIKMFVKNGFDVDIVCSNVGGKIEMLKEKLSEIKNLNIFVADLRRNPLSLSNLNGYKQLKHYLKHNIYDVIITNEPVMSVVTRLAARTQRRKKSTKVVYFAHGLHFWKGAPKINWIFFYSIEWFAAHFTDVIVTINTNDFDTAKHKLPAKNVLYFHGIGVSLDKFFKDTEKRILKRKELGISDDTFMIYCTSELNDNKNLKLAVDILKKLKDKGYNIVYFNRGVGEKFDCLNSYAEQMGLKDIFNLPGYGKDVDEMCNAADAFLFTSKREGLPVAVMEAMSCELPCIVSDIRGSADLIVNGEGGYLCSLDNTDEFVQRISQLIENLGLSSELTKNNMKILEPYSFDNINKEIISLVDSL